MPRRTKNAKKDPVVPKGGGVGKEKIVKIAEGAAVDNLINDFDVQVEAMVKQALKQFDKETKLLMSALPMKSSIPKEILKMELSEFIRRGGSFQTVWESLKREKEEGMVSTEPEKRDDVHVSQASAGEVQQDMFTTPALGTRSSQRVKELTDAKRRPKPLEEIRVQAYSNQSGSPVDEKTLLQLHSDELLGDIKHKIMDVAAKFPQKWRSKLVQSFRELKAQASINEDNILVTPAINR